LSVYPFGAKQYLNQHFQVIAGYTYLDLPFLLLDLPLTPAQGAHHDLILRHVIPLATLSIGIRSFLIVLGRRLFRDEYRAAS